MIVHIDESAAAADCLLPAAVAEADVGTTRPDARVTRTGWAHALKPDRGYHADRTAICSCQDQAFKADDVSWFLGRLCARYCKQHLLVIWDGASIHRSQAVQPFPKHWPGRL